MKTQDVVLTDGLILFVFLYDLQKMVREPASGAVGPDHEAKLMSDVVPQGQLGRGVPALWSLVVQDANRLKASFLGVYDKLH